MRRRGKKAIQWQKDRAKLIKEAAAKERIFIDNGYPEGACEDCRRWYPLDPDHVIKRSQGGSNDSSNIEWVCRMCHDRRDNQGGKSKWK